MRAKSLSADGCIGLCSPSHVPIYEAAPGQEMAWAREYKNIIGKMEEELSGGPGGQYV